jgi:hypothetical protein
MDENRPRQRFIPSDASSFQTGSAMLVDCGMSNTRT